MLAGEQYKRAANTGGLRRDESHEDPDRQFDVAMRALRIASDLSCIPAVPTPDLADRLAGALVSLCGDDRGVMLQIGRFEGPGGWACESVGVAGRLRELPSNAATRPGQLPWPGLSEGDSSAVYLVSQPKADQAGFNGLVSAFASVNLGLELAGLACGRHPGALTITVQVGGNPSDDDAAGIAARAWLLRRLLPWMHAIVRAALAENGSPATRPWLTDRERVVLDGLVEGGSVTEIAEALGRSRYTVHDQVKSLHRKLGVHTRAALVGCAIRSVPLPPSDGMLGEGG